MKTTRIRFKAPDPRAGQEVDLDAAGARRLIDEGAAEEIVQEETSRSREHHPDPEHRGTPAKKTTGRSR